MSEMTQGGGLKDISLSVEASDLSASSTVVDLDAWAPNVSAMARQTSQEGFENFVRSQLANLQIALLRQREQELSSLRAENQALRECLAASSRVKSKVNGRKSSAPQDGNELSQEPRKSDVNQRLQKSGASPDPKAEESTSPCQASSEANADEGGISGADRSTSETIKTAAQCRADQKKQEALQKKLSSAAPRAEPSTMARGSRLQRVVLSQSFEIASGCVILANTVMMALRLQYDGIGIGFDINYTGFAQSSSDTWPRADTAFYVIEIMFNVVFIMELLLRIAALHVAAFFSGWTWFDAAIIGISTVDTFASTALPINPSMLRLMRLVRLLRLFKILKAMQSFESLFLLVKAVRASVSAATWSFSLLVSVQLIMGLFLNQVAQTYLADDALSSEAATKKVFEYYGTFSRTMLTMFEITMANWAVPCHVLTEHVSELFILFFILYRCLFCFAVLKVIAAVFITETNRVLQHDDELTLMKIARERNMFDKKVRKVMSTFAEETFGWHELQEVAYDPEVVSALTTLGFHSQDLEKLFFLFDNGSGQVNAELFLSKVGTLQGQAKAIDVLTLLKITRKIDAEVSKVFEEQGYLSINQEEEKVEDEVCKL